VFAAISEVVVGYLGQAKSEIKVCESILQVSVIPVSSQKVTFTLFFLNWFTVDKRHVNM